MISRKSLIQRLKRGREARARFVESHLNKSMAFQIRALRDSEKWTQGEFAAKLGMNHPNNVSARLENPNYGKHTLTTLKNIAATCDVGLVVWFVPFSRLVDWASGTPYKDPGLSPTFYDISPFDSDEGLADVSTLDATAMLGKLTATQTVIEPQTKWFSALINRGIHAYMKHDVRLISGKESSTGESSSAPSSDIHESGATNLLLMPRLALRPSVDMKKIKRRGYRRTKRHGFARAARA